MLIQTDKPAIYPCLVLRDIKKGRGARTTEVAVARGISQFFLRIMVARLQRIAVAAT